MNFEKKYIALKDKHQLLKAESKKAKEVLMLSLKNSKIEQNRIQKFSRVLILRQEENRKKISRELHDEIAQVLTGINYELEILSKEASKSEKSIRDKISQTQHMIVGSVDLIHRFARDLRPIILDDLGLSAALQSFIKDFEIRTEIKVKLISDVKGTSFDDFSKTTLFRIAQEAFTNIEKHAKAKNVLVEIKKDKEHLIFVISDDGVSFKKSSFNSLNTKSGIGLLGIQDRISMLNGILSIHSSKKIGTLIKILIPLNNLKNSKT